MESVFEAFISNPALYSAGHLVGETLHFPTNTEEVQSLLKRIGVDGVRCQEYFIISFLHQKARPPRPRRNRQNRNLQGRCRP